MAAGGIRYMYIQTMNILQPAVYAYIFIMKIVHEVHTKKNEKLTST